MFNTGTLSTLTAMMPGDNQANGGSGGPPGAGGKAGAAGAASNPDQN